MIEHEDSIAWPSTQNRLRQWEDDILNERDNVDHVLDCAWRDGRRLGINLALETCIAWLGYNYPSVNCAALRADVAPSPPSLAEQGLEALDRMDQLTTDKDQRLIRAALERLQELEKGNE